MWRVLVFKSVHSKAVFCWLYIPTVCLLLIVAIASYSLNIPVAKFTRDPLAITGGHPFLGLVSSIGIVLWSFSVAICLFTYVLLKTGRKSGDIGRFIMLGGFISLVMLLDDFFMLHDYIYPIYLGVNEKAVLVFYGMLILYYLVRFRKIIRNTERLFILLAVLFFVLSVVVDLLPESFLPWHHIFEDGTKLIGIASWFGYQFSVCLEEVQFTACRDTTPQ